jgi:Domain of unknown function (DUF3291)
MSLLSFDLYVIHDVFQTAAVITRTVTTMTTTNARRHQLLTRMLSYRHNHTIRLSNIIISSSRRNKSDATNTNNDDHHHQQPPPPPPFYFIAHMNYAKLKAPMNDPCMDELRHAMKPINDIAKTIPGYIWSFDSDHDHVYYENMRNQVPLLQHDPLIMPQLSLWTNLQAIQHFAYKSGHYMYWKRRKEWFVPVEDTTSLHINDSSSSTIHDNRNNHKKPIRYSVCWWWRNHTIDNNNNNNNENNNTISSSLSSSYPTLKEAFERCDYLNQHGPSDYAFDFATAKHYPMPTK